MRVSNLISFTLTAIIMSMCPSWNCWLTIIHHLINRLLEFTFIIKSKLIIAFVFINLINYKSNMLSYLDKNKLTIHYLMYKFAIMQIRTNKNWTQGLFLIQNDIISMIKLSFLHCYHHYYAYDLYPGLLFTQVLIKLMLTVNIIRLSVKSLHSLLLQKY